MTERVNVGLVAGDPAGIGPEIAIKTIIDGGLADGAALYVLGGSEIISKANAVLGNPVEVLSIDASQVGAATLSSPGVVRVVECDTVTNPNFAWGVSDGRNGANTLNAIHRAFDLAAEGRLDCVVIGPLGKKALNLGGSQFADETQLMAHLTNSSDVKNVAKWNNIFRTGVVGHVRFRDIVKNLTADRIEKCVKVLADTMREFGAGRPRIGVAALNPHAGEGGEFGDEEITLLAPVVAKFADSDLDVSGPFPSDTILHRAMRGDFEGIVFLYHDQGNIALKAASFGESVLLYTGLPLPVTGVGHGVAYDLAGQGRADHRNLLMAINAAADMAATRRGRAKAG